MRRVIWSLCLLATITASQCAQFTVTTPVGSVLGREYFSPENNSYYGFHGIPYAKPPLNELRFEPPQKAESWEGVLNGTYERPSCVSSMYLVNQGNESEDCLTLNVYVPTSQSTEKLPVILWIYGGAFVSGNTSKHFYNPDYFMDDQGVILVAINYRIGPFGYLSMGDAIFPGNYGFKDMVMALQWTYDNIDSFGGDPTKITLMGQSAGAASIPLLMANQQSNGLFRAVIRESGGALSPWSVTDDPQSIVSSLLSSLSSNYSMDNSTAIKLFLQSKTATEIMTAWPVLNPVTQPLPVIEVEHEGAFITQYHYDMIASGNISRVPHLTGVADEESLIFFGNKETALYFAEEIDANNSLVVTENLHANASVVNEATSAIKSLYLQDNTTFADDLVAFVKYYSDNYFAKSCFKEADLVSQYSPIYFYYFNYYGHRLPVVPFLEGAGNVSHSGEVPYLFNIDLYSSTDAADNLTQKRLIKLWTNFAKYLNPTPEQLELLDNVTWPVYTADSPLYLNITETLSIGSGFRSDYRTAWWDIYEKYGDFPLDTY